MYVTRPLSLYKNSASELYKPLPEGPNTGILVIQDEATEARCCFGLCKDTDLKVMPFPQNKNLQLYYTISGANGSTYADWVYAFLIPVLNQPLSSNQYYFIKSRGSRKGNAFTSSKEEDMKTCCFCRHPRDIPPQPFDIKNTYQQFVISKYKSCGCSSGFVANSIADDGFPPKFLGWNGWYVDAKPLKHFEPTEAFGLDAALRGKLPEFTFTLPSKSSNPVIIAKWYSPFIFIKDGAVDNQVSKSMFYELSLEQNWEEIFECRNNGDGGNGVAVDVIVQRVLVYVGGLVVESVNVGDGVLGFGASHDVGLSLAIVERVKWEQERGGFKWVEIDGGRYGEEERVKRREEFNGDWRRFGCYVLVEKYVLKRMDGSLVLTWEFKHTHQIRNKWE